MDIRLRKSGQMSIVSIAGSIDASTADHITSFVDERISSGEKHLVIDLSEVEFMSSAGLRIILGALKEIRKQEGNLYLAGPQAGVERVLKMSGFSKIVKIYDNVDKAILKHNF
jgi:anti-anti-sigma factor